VNRETKRLMQRQGQVTEDGTPATRRPTAPPRRPPEPEKAGIPERTGQYLREVKIELAKVAWPDRSEVTNYSVVVFVTLVVLVLLIFFLNWIFAKGVFALYP
jgi:preprotein translocase subunit SecE